MRVRRNPMTPASAAVVAGPAGRGRRDRLPGCCPLPEIIPPRRRGTDSPLAWEFRAGRELGDGFLTRGRWPSVVPRGLQPSASSPTVRPGSPATDRSLGLRVGGRAQPTASWPDPWPKAPSGSTAWPLGAALFAGDYNRPCRSPGSTNRSGSTDAKTPGPGTSAPHLAYGRGQPEPRSWLLTKIA